MAGFHLLSLLVLCLLHCGVTQAEVSLTIEPKGETHRRELGSSLILTCQANGLGQDVNPHLQWYDTEDQPISEKSDRIYIKTDSLHLRRLYITDIRLTDLGTYNCTGTLNGKYMTAQTRLVHTVIAPVIEMLPPSGKLDLMVGDVASLWCIIKAGDPRPTIQWIKGTNKTVISEGEQLELGPVRSGDGGDYSCIVSNGVEGNKFASFNSVVYDYTSLSGFSGARVLIANIHAARGYGCCWLSWYSFKFRPGDTVDDKYEVAEWFGLSKSGWVFQPGYEVNDNNGDLLIPAAKLGQGGWYTAYLNDPINGKMYAYMYLNISVAPAVASIGGLDGPINSTVTQRFTCTTLRVKPKYVVFNWSLSSHEVVHSESVSTENADGTWKVVSTMMHSFSKEDNGGVLTCTIQHGLDRTKTTSDSKDIIVHYPYHVSTDASGPNKLPSIGEDFKLFCKIIDDGNPQGDTYFWYKDGNTHQPLKDGNKYSGTETSELTIKQLVMKDDGEYECQLLNGAGMSETDNTYHLKVRDPALPYDVIIQPRQSIVDVGDFIQMFCSIKLNSMKDGVRWRIAEKIIYQTYPENFYYDKERYEVHDSGASNVSIMIKNVMKSDEGSYRCESIAHPTSYKVSDVIIAESGSGPTFEVKINPRQTITELGASPTIRCTVDLGKNQDSLRWKRVDDDGISKTIFQTYRTVFDYNKDKYSIRIPKRGTVDLTIKNISSEDGGKYICEPMVHADKGKVAELVIRL